MDFLVLFTCSKQVLYDNLQTLLSSFIQVHKTLPSIYSYLSKMHTENMYNGNEYTKKLAQVVMYVCMYV
jgi:hypothetical protein